jgi:hypothetical protein
LSGLGWIQVQAQIKKGAFWTMVHNFYHFEKEITVHRSSNSPSHHWGTIQESVNKLCSQKKHKTIDDSVLDLTGNPNEEMPNANHNGNATLDGDAPKRPMDRKKTVTPRVTNSLIMVISVLILHQTLG